MTPPAGEDRSSERGDIQRLATGAGLALAGKGVGKIIYLATQVMLARILGPAGFGFYAIGWTVTRVAGVISPLGLDQGIIRFGSTFRQRDEASLRGVFFASNCLAAGAGAILGVALWWAAPWLAHVVFDKPELGTVLRLFAIAFPFLPLLRVAAAGTRISKRMAWAVATEDLGQPMIQVVMIGLLAAGGLALEDAILAATLSIAASALLAVTGELALFPELRLRRPVRWSLGELVRFSLPAVSANSFVMFILWSDRLFVGALLPVENAGVYQAASQVAIVFAVILGAFNTIFAPLAADLYQRRELARLRKLYRTATRWGLYATGPLFSALLAAPSFWLKGLFGASYTSGSVALAILTAAQLVNMATGSIALLLVLGGNERSWLRISATAFAVNLVLNALLIPRFGLVGAAVATAVALSSLFVAGAMMARKRLGAWPLGKEAAGVAIGVPLALIAARGIHLAIIGAWWVEAASMLVVTTLVFAAAVVAPGVKSEDRELAALILKRLKKSVRLRNDRS